MSLTTKIPPERLVAYFEAFTRRFLRDDSPEAVAVLVLEPEWGDQYAAEGAHLIGITYDPRSEALEFALEGGDHRVYRPEEVWVLEEEDGFLSAIEIVRTDGTREVVSVKRAGPLHAR